MKDSDRDERKAHLEELFQQWDQRSGDDGPDLEESVEEDLDPFRRPDTTRWRGIFALIVMLVSAYVMEATYPEFSYWLKDGDAPVDLGHFGDHWREGKRDLALEDNSYVKTDGMFVTYAMESIRDANEAPDDERPSYRYFLCPLFDTLVRTSQPFPEARGHWGAQTPIDPAFLELIQDRRAFPENLAATFKGQGRLVTIDHAPLSARAAVGTFKQRIPGDTDHFFLLLDGEEPADYSHYAILWAAAFLVPLLPLFLFLRALRRRRKLRASHA